MGTFSIPCACCSSSPPPPPPGSPFAQARSCLDNSLVDLWFADATGTTINTTSGSATPLPFYFKKDGIFYKVPSGDPTDPNGGTLASGYTVESACPTTATGNCFYGCNVNNATVTFFGMTTPQCINGVDVFLGEHDVEYNRSFSSACADITVDFVQRTQYADSHNTSGDANVHGDSNCTSPWKIVGTRTIWRFWFEAGAGGTRIAKATGELRWGDGFSGSGGRDFFVGQATVANCNQIITIPNTQSEGGYVVFYPGA